MFDVSREVAEHLNRMRPIISSGASPKVPAVAFHTYAKAYTPPDSDVEPYIHDIVHVRFHPWFSDTRHAHFYLQRS